MEVMVRKLRELTLGKKQGFENLPGEPPGRWRKFNGRKGEPTAL